MGKNATEFRGVDNLVYALITEDSEENYTTGDVKDLAPIGKASKKIDQNKITKYYDNKPAFTIQSRGADNLTLTVAVIELPVLAEITGQAVDSITGAIYEGGEKKDKYFALGYRTKKVDGTYSYIWKYKASAQIPDEESTTENESTDSTPQELLITCVNTIHEFQKGGSLKGIRVDESDGKANLTSFFGSVTTPDTLQPKTP